MPKITVKDIEINYEEEGTGPPVILVHGLSDDLTLWMPLTPELSRCYRTIAIDVRGHGHTSKPDMSYSIKLFSEDLSGLVEKLKISQAHMTGFSMGGSIAQQFALNHPEKVRSLVLLSAFSYVDSGLRNILIGFRNSITEGGLPAFFDEAVKLTVTPEFASANSEAIARLREVSVRINNPVAILHAIDACLGFDVKHKISKISLRTLIVSGRNDILTPLHLAGQIHRSMDSSEWKIMENVGHNLLIPENTPELTQIILRFLGHH